MRTYFTTLGDSAHPNSSDPRARAITNFQELLLVSFREFSIITSETIHSERRRFRGEVVVGIEGFARRAAVRSLKDFGRLGKERAGLVYDVLYRAMCVVPPPPVVVVGGGKGGEGQGQGQGRLVDTGAVGEGMEEKPETRIGLRTFQYFLSEVATWARNEKVVMNGFQVGLFFSFLFEFGLLGVDVVLV
jgi:TBC1 domain family member 8/9